MVIFIKRFKRQAGWKQDKGKFKGIKFIVLKSIKLNWIHILKKSLANNVTINIC